MIEFVMFFEMWMDWSHVCAFQLKEGVIWLEQFSRSQLIMLCHFLLPDWNMAQVMKFVWEFVIECVKELVAHHVLCNMAQLTKFG